MTRPTRARRQALVDQLVIQGVAPRLLRARRKLPAGARRADRPRHRAHRLPPGRRRGDDGRGGRQGDRSAGRLLRHPRPRRDQRRARRPHRPPELQPDDPVRRPGRPRRRAAATPGRSSTTPPCSARWPSGRPRSTTRPACPRWSRAPSTSRCNGQPGPVVLALPHDMLIEAIDAADAPAWPSRSSHRPARPTWRALEALLGEAAVAVRAARRQRAGTRRRAPRCTRFAERFELPVATGFRRLPLFDPLHPNYAGDLGLGAQSEAAGPGQGRRPGAGDRRAAQRRHHAGLHAVRASPSRRAKLVHVFPERRGARPRLAPAPGHQRRPDPLRRRARRALAAGKPTPGAARPRRRTPSTSPGRRPPTPQPGAVNLGEIMIWLREHLPADAILTNGAGNFAAWVNRFYRVRRFGGHLAPELRLDGLRRAGGGGHAAALPGAGAWWRSAATATS